MRVAYIYDAIYPYVKGGAEKRIYEISRRMAEKGHEVHLFGAKWWSGVEVRYENGVFLHGICEPREFYVNGRRSIEQALYFARKLLFSLDSHFDIVDCQQSPYLHCFSAKVHSTLRKMPLIVTWYEFWGDYWYEYLGRKGVLGKTLERLILELPDKIIPISERIREDLLLSGVSSNRMEVVSNGVDFYGIQNVRELDDVCDVIYVGRLSKHKNVDLLLKAVKLLRKKVPSIRCRIVGDGPEKENLTKLVRNLGLEGNVKLLGFLQTDEEVISNMKSAKVFVLPSTREGFPNTILEANACGLSAIVVKGEKNAATSLIEEGKNGFVCNFSEEDIADKILVLLRSEEKRKELHCSSKANAERFDWSIIVDKMENVYQELVG